MSLKRKLISLAVVAGAAAGLAPLGGPAAANCDNPVLLFTRVGVFLPVEVEGRNSVGHPTYETGQWGCTVGDAAGLTVDSNYIYPGATMALSSLYDFTGTTNGGCIRSDQGLVNWCGTLKPTPQTLPTSPHYTDSPWVPIDPTKQGTIYATIDGWGQSNTYRTIDR